MVGITLPFPESLGSQVFIVSNSCNLVEVLRRQLSLGHSHWSRPPHRHEAPRPTRSRRSVSLSLFLRQASPGMSTHRLRHFAPLHLLTSPTCLPHTTDASTQLSVSEFLQLCLTKHPFRRTVPLQLHGDLTDAHCPSNTSNSMEVTFADAATQLSFAEFFEKCILSKALPPRPSPSP